MLLSLDEIAISSMSFCAPTDLLSMILICKRMERLANLDFLWRPLCLELWKAKLHVVDRRDLSRKHAYFSSLHEARQVVITRAQLVAMSFCFRFKEASGDEWTARDPWWNGKRARGIQFLADGNCTIYPTGHPTFAAQDIPPPPFAAIPEDDHTTNVTLRWALKWSGKDSRCCQQAAALQEQRVAFFERLRGVGPRRSTRVQRNCSIEEVNGGNTLALTVNGLLVPLYYVRRVPNWGFIFESCWAVYSSFPMPLRSVGCVYTHDAAMTVSCEDQEDEIDHYNAQILNGWNGESDDDNDDEGDDEDVEEGV